MRGVTTRGVAQATARTPAAPVTFRSKFLLPLLVPLGVAAKTGCIQITMNIVTSSHTLQHEAGGMVGVLTVTP
jgi:hypothetical protein